MKYSEVLRDLALEWRSFPERVVGKALRAVSYMHSDPLWPDEYRLDAFLHEPEFAAVLHFDDDDLIVVWEMVGEIETIRCRSGRLSELIAEGSMGGEVVNVSDVAPISSLIGERIDRASILLANDSPYPIGVSMTFRNTVMRIELGEWRDGQIDRMPDALVVQFLTAS